MKASKSQIAAFGFTLLAFAGYLWIRRKQHMESDTPSVTINTDNMNTYPELDLRPYGVALPRGYRNNNPVNIEYNAANKWLGQVGIAPEGRFSQFVSLPYGYRAALALLRGKGYIGKGINTISKIISKFAPKSENYTDTYIKFVSDKSGINKDAVLTKNDRDALCKVVWAMAQFENGNTSKTAELGLPNMEVINQGWNLL